MRALNEEGKGKGQENKERKGGPKEKHKRARSEPYVVVIYARRVTWIGDGQSLTPIPSSYPCDYGS